MGTKLATLVLSMSSLGVAISTYVSLGRRVDERSEIKDPMGKGMKGYDFTTPKASYLSKLRIIADQDLRAMLELESMKTGKIAKERLSTLEIHKEMDDKQGKVLFISYEEEGIKKYEVVKLDRDGSTGFWEIRGATFEKVGKVGDPVIPPSEAEKLQKQKIEAWKKDGTIK